MTLHGYALNDIEAGTLSAIRERHEFDRGRVRAEFPQWKTIDTLLGWHDRLVSMLAEREAEIDRLRKSAIQHDHDVCQLLGRALGYPRFVEDQKNFPGATDFDVVFVADHVPETLAAEAAEEIDRLRAELLKTPTTLEWLESILGEADAAKGMHAWAGHADLVWLDGACCCYLGANQLRTRADVLAAVKSD